jgi:NDP-sugar pyrophosphorylase family protein
MNATVLITTSGTGSRLYNHTKNTNKSLLNIGDKYALCYIIENYDKDTEFIVTLGYYGNHVKQFLTIAYPDYNIKFVEIDKYEGLGSSLGYSLLKCKEQLNKPFYFHCCDSIIMNKIPSHNNCNTLFLFNTLDFNTYSTAKVNLENKSIIQVNKKGVTYYDYGYTGVCYINDYNLFWKYLEEIYNNNRDNFELSDVDAIIKMINNNVEFKYVLLNEYYDSGNCNSLNILRNIVKRSYDVIEKPNESICFIDNKVIKFNINKECIKKIYTRHLHMNNTCAKITSYSDNFICMEKINGTIMSKLNYNCINDLLNYFLNNLWNDTSKDFKYKENCYNFYINKTLSRINLLDLVNEKNIINGIQCLPIKQLINNLDEKYYNNDTLVKFHGDFIFDNILKCQDKFLLIDWRESFDENLIYGDIYYEFAKLKHNLIFNHTNILNKLFTIHIHENEVNVDLKCNYLLMEQMNDLDKFLIEHNYDIKKVNILMSIVWLNMSPLYDGNLRWFLFYFGKYNLTKFLN